MSSGYKLRDLHAKRVHLELQLGGRWVAVAGIGDYADGRLQIPIKDPDDKVTVVLDEAAWNGEIIAAPDGNSFLIRLDPPASG
jgi:hypothetical protein